MLAFIVIVAIWNLSTTSLPNPSDRLESEKEIYSLLLAGIYSNGGIPLIEYTTLGYPTYSGFSEEDFSLWNNKNHNLKQETFANFVEINQQSYSIREYLPREISDQIKGQQDMLVSLSRIGFNSQLTQSLVVKKSGMGCDNKGDCCYSEGSVLFLQKIHDQWIIKDELMNWIEECNA